MELQDYSISKYIDWYKNLSEKIENYHILQERYKRLALILYKLYQRNLQIEVKQNKLLNAIKKEIKVIDCQKNEVKIYVDESNPLFNLYHIPTFEDWYLFSIYRNKGLEALAEFITEKINRSALPEIQIYKAELKRKNDENTNLQYRYAYEGGTPILKQNITENFVFDFANEVSDIDYCIWIQSKIDELTENDNDKKQAKNIKPLQWNGTKKDFSELVKSLALTVFSGTPETEIIKKIAPLIQFTKDNSDETTSFNSKRHSVNINELQDVAPQGLFTKKLYTSINSFLEQKITR